MGPIVKILLGAAGAAAAGYGLYKAFTREGDDSSSPTETYTPPQSDDTENQASQQPSDDQCDQTVSEDDIDAEDVVDADVIDDPIEDEPTSEPEPEPEVVNTPLTDEEWAKVGYLSNSVLDAAIVKLIGDPQEVLGYYPPSKKEKIAVLRVLAKHNLSLPEVLRTYLAGKAAEATPESEQNSGDDDLDLDPNADVSVN